MMVSKVTNFAALATGIKRVNAVTISHVIASLMISTIRTFSARVCCNADNDALRNLTLYSVDNAFNRIQMRQNPHCIFMCSVIDIMHTVLQHGFIMYALESFKSFLNPKKLQMLDKMAIQFNATCRQSIRLSSPASISLVAQPI
jgi:hypothetical protein